jgi:bacterial/archaeal transporter family-2 protein
MQSLDSDKSPSATRLHHHDINSMPYSVRVAPSQPSPSVTHAAEVTTVSVSVSKPKPLLKRETTIYRMEAHELGVFERICYSLVAICIGGLIVAQAGLNVRLGKGLDSPLYAAWFNFTAAWLAVMPIALSRGPSWSIVRERLRTAPLHLYTPGLLGCFYVAMSIAISPKLSLSIFFVLAVLGQLLAGVALDHFGMFGLPVRRITWPTVVGLICTLGGCLMLQDIVNTDSLDLSIWELIGYSLLALLAGFALPVQATLNKQMAYFVGTNFRALFLSFTEGMLGLAVACLFVLGKRGWSFQSYSAPDPHFVWYFPVLVGLAYVYSSTVIGPRKLGMTLFYTLLVLGQLSGALYLDHVGFMDFETKSANAMRVIGVTVAFAGSTLARTQNASTHDSDTNDSTSEQSSSSSSSNAGCQSETRSLEATEQQCHASDEEEQGIPLRTLHVSSSNGDIQSSPEDVAEHIRTVLH